MLRSKVHSDTIGDWLGRLLCAAIAAWLAINIYAFFLANYATARFWETWITPGSPMAEWAPVVAFALITGIAIGIAIGTVFPRHALKVAAAAAFLQLVAAVVAGGIPSSILLAAGLLLGAAPSRTAH